MLLGQESEHSMTAMPISIIESIGKKGPALKNELSAIQKIRDKRRWLGANHLQSVVPLVPFRQLP